MTDLEITRLCAAAMGYEDKSVGKSIGGIMVSNGVHHFIWKPLEYDEQAMALVKKFPLPCLEAMTYHVRYDDPPHDLNRAICECAAKLQQAKEIKHVA